MGRPRGAAVATPGNPFRWAQEQFCSLWEEAYGAPYEPTPADLSQLGRLLRGLSREAVLELPRAYRGYLNDLSPFVAQEQRHSLRYFCTSGGFNKYRVEAPMLSAREAKGSMAVRQFVELTGGRNGNGRHRP